MREMATASGVDPVFVEATFPAAPARVFRAWTVPAEVKKWFGSNPGALESAVINLRPGGRWCFTESTSAAGSVGFEGEYLQIEGGTKLVFTWSKFTEDPSGHREGTPSSRVEVQFNPSGEGTHLTIRHSAIGDSELRADFAFGWTRALPNLETAVQL